MDGWPPSIPPGASARWPTTTVRRYGFHATAIADGSRRIGVGTTVVFTVTPGHRGLYEARSLSPVPG